MLLGAWAVGLALLFGFFDRVIDRQVNPNSDPVATLGPDGAQQVVLRRNRSGQYVASGRIEGHPVRFLVDTGATNVALPLDLARKLQLPLRPGGNSMTANGMVRTWSTSLDRLELGGLVGRDVRASVLPNMPGDSVLLGMSFLRHLELVQRGDTLTLRRHASP
ncbi:retropepsin-like aspartic protease family protein [Imhoffiella purpurea]|uniref:Putative aspartyl protease n=1 Tax=Imhoffiella purpurea TaxID=1249627 RepID=W9VZW0_9GAMM|nr:TIGR02281 family clan AA aspartic protease [Imhoffiella purpurea]EXJ15895.1 Putative aspartyl protease [Imhoffiella purpurea]